MQTQDSLTRLKSLPVDALIDLVKNYRYDSETADKAYDEFLIRYGGVLKAKCRYAAGIHGLKALVILQDIESIATQLAYHQSRTYHPCEDTSPKAMDKHVAGWLATIAEIAAGMVEDEEGPFYKMHVFTGDYAESCVSPDDQEPMDVESESAKDRLEALQEKRRAMLDEAMTKLSKREREVLHVKGEAKDGKKYLDHKQVGSACRRLRISKENFYTISSRAIRKLKDRLLQTEEQGEPEIPDS